MVKPLARALMTLTALAAVSGSLPKSMMNTRPIRTNSGAPGGCGTWSLKQELTNSPQSHKLPPASAVITYTVQAMSATTQPVMLLIFWNDMVSCSFEWQT